MEEKFNDNFLDSENTNRENKLKNGFNSTKTKYLIDIDKIDKSKYENVCVDMFKLYEKCKEKIDSLSRKELCDKSKNNLLECLNKAGKSIR